MTKEIVGSEEDKMAAIIKLLESLEPDTAMTFAFAVMKGMGDGFEKWKDQITETPSETVPPTQAVAKI